MRRKNQSQEDLQQEKNVKFVALTRAKKTLLFVSEEKKKNKLIQAIEEDAKETFDKHHGHNEPFDEDAMARAEITAFLRSRFTFPL
jgi:ATP-dependent exoDNAse (exonuclease V) beta subunit